MARAFSGTGQYLSVSASPISGAPFSVAAWAWSTNNTGTQNVWTQASGSPAFDGWYLHNFSGTFAFQSYAGSAASASASTGTTTGQWNHVLGVEASSTSRAVYLNGGNKGTNTTSKTPTVGGGPKVGIGCWDVGGASELWNGRIACVTLWNVALDDTDAAILAKGVHPFLVKPVSIVNHWELMGRFSPEIDIAGGIDITVTSATQIDHPRLYGYIRRPYAHFGNYVPYTAPVLTPNLVLYPKEKMRLAI